MPIENSAPSVSQIEQENKSSFFDQFGGLKTYVEKYSAIKQVAHAWQIGGIGYINHLAIELEGTRFIDFRETFRKYLQDLYTTNPIFSSEEIELLSLFLNEREEGTYKQGASLLT